MNEWLKRAEKPATTYTMKYQIGTYVLLRNPGHGFTPAANRIEEGFRVGRVMFSNASGFVAVRVMNSTESIEAISPDWPTISREEATTLLLGDTNTPDSRA